MESILVILTHAYPFAPPSEQFLHNEVNVLKGYFHRILIIPTSHSAWVNEKNDIHSPNIVIRRIKRRSKIIEIAGTFFSAILFSRGFYREAAIIFKKKLSFNRHAIQTLFAALINAKIISDSVFKEIISLGINNSSNIIIYSYWLSHLSNAGIIVKDKLAGRGYKNVKVISRAHGSHDVFISEAMGNYKPGIYELNNGIDNIYSISDAGKKYLEAIGFNPGKIIVNRLGVTDDGLKLIMDRKKPFLIVSCSSMVSIKRIGLIAEALGRITDIEIEWVHFGDGPLKAEIEKLASTILSGGVKAIFMGNVGNHEVLNFYKVKSPDLFINVSSIEGIPVSIMEAQSYGIPVIAADVGGNRESVIDGYNGYLLKKDFDVSELSQSIMKVINMKGEEYMTLCMNSRRVFQDRFNAEKNYKEFVNYLLG